MPDQRRGNDHLTRGQARTDRAPRALLVVDLPAGPGFAYNVYALRDLLVHLPGPDQLQLRLWDGPVGLRLATVVRMEVDAPAVAAALAPLVERVEGATLELRGEPDQGGPHRPADASRGDLGGGGLSAGCSRPAPPEEAS